MEENGIISLNVHADSLEKVTTVITQYSEILCPNSETKEIVASSIIITTIIIIIPVYTFKCMGAEVNDTTGGQCDNSDHSSPNTFTQYNNYALILNSYLGTE